jgi:hypothetical protein
VLQPGRVQLTNSDRLFFIQLYRWFPSVLKAITIIRPETLVRWHRKLAEPRITSTGKRIPGLKLDHPRQLALMHAVVRFAR